MNYKTLSGKRPVADCRAASVGRGEENQRHKGEEWHSLTPDEVGWNARRIDGVTVTLF